ncbi:MAG: periplasmic heavy metal sensor [Acidobacteria bacterium]|nr:MAG: periplasmic heavy metal sensor [Acidobacteriota bacterium]
MILKSLSVFAACAALGAATASPLLAQRPAAAQTNQSGRNPGKPSNPQGQPPSRPAPWWADEKSKKELGLTPEQAKAIDDIYTSTKDEMAGYRDSVERERKELDRLIAESKVERWVILRQIDRMETARSNYNKTWFMMLYRMNQQLTVEQRAKLQALLDRERRGRGGERRDPRPHD